MNFAQVDKFFTVLGRALPVKTVIVLTGGMAASILADPRTTDDIDFALIKPLVKQWPEVEAVLTRLASKHGIVLQYAADIDRWSSVSYLDWQKHTRPYKIRGALEVRVLDPLYWSIGKIARGTDRDVQDLEAVLKAQKVGWQVLLKLWAKALRKSPPSTALFNAKKQMQRFVKESGTAVWGKKFDPAAALLEFEKGLRAKP